MEFLIESILDEIEALIKVPGMDKDALRVCIANRVVLKSGVGKYDLEFRYHRIYPNLVHYK